MNKKLLSLAVAAAIAAPTAAMAEAILYGKLNVSLDYVDVTNAILPYANTYPTSGSAVVFPSGTLPNSEWWAPDFPVNVGRTGPAFWVRNGQNIGLYDPNVAQPSWAVGAVPVGAQTVGGGENFTGWGMANGYIPNSVAYNNLGARSAGGGRASRLGVKGSEDLGNGLKAIYQIEFGINPTDTNNNVANNNDAITMRNTFVGLAGDWGTALMGRHDTPLKISTGKLDLFVDTLADMNATVGFQDLRADNAVAYISPNWSGFSFAAAIVPSGGANALGSQNTEADGINEGWSVAGIYSNGPFYGSLAYESLSYDLFNSNANNFGCASDSRSCSTQDNDWNKWRLGLGLLDWNGFSLTGIYEQHEGIAGSDAFIQGPAYDVKSGKYLGYTWVLPGGPNKATMWQIQAGYSFGNSMVKAMYGVTQFDTDDFVAVPGVTGLQSQGWNDYYEGDRSTWAIGFDHNFSKRTKVYALYTDVADDRADWVAGSEWSGFSLGMMHSF